MFCPGFLLTLGLVPLVGLAAEATKESRLWVADGRLEAQELALSPNADLRELVFSAGPRIGVGGLAALRAGTITGQLAVPLQERGSVALWFHPDRPYRSGQGAGFVEQRLLEIDQLIAVSFVAEPESVTLYVGWGPRRDVVTPGARGTRRGIAFEQVIRVILPEFPAAWHHLTLNWDSSRNEANAYLDGTPYERPGAKIEPWKPRRGEHLTVHLDPHFQLADIRIRPSPVASEELRAIVGRDHWGAMDAWLGVADLGAFTADRRRGRTLYARSLETGADTQGWRLEGPGEVTHAANGMTVRSLRPDGPNGHVVYWAPEDFPPDFVAEFDFEVLTEHGLNILFFAARGTEGQEAFAPALQPRDGTFIQYTHGDLNSYHISYFANSPNDARSVANLRKNSGFFLLANGPVGLSAGGRGETRHALLLKSGAHLVMAVDGRKIIDFTDDGERAGPVWQGGKIGFRQMQWSATRYHNLRVSALRPESAPP